MIDKSNNRIVTSGLYNNKDKNLTNKVMIFSSAFKNYKKFYFSPKNDVSSKKSNSHQPEPPTRVWD